MVDYTKKAIKGTIITFIGIFSAAFFAYLTRVILARSLSPSDYGLFFAIFVFLSFIEFFKDFGTNAALVKYIAEFKVQKKYNLIKSSLVITFLFQFSISLVLVIILFYFSDHLALNFFKNQNASLIIKLLSLVFIFNIFDNLLRKIVHGYNKMHLLALLEFFRNLFIFIFIFIFLKAGFKIMAPTYSYIISPILVFLIFSFIAIRFFISIKTKIKLNLNLFKKLLFFGIPSIFASFSDQIIAFADVLILTFFIGKVGMITLDKIGIYNVVLPTALLILYFGRSIALVMMPLSSELWAKKEYAILAGGVARLHKYILIIVVPVALTIFSFSRLYLHFFFGDQYASGAIALQLIIIGTIFFTLAKINNTVIQNTGKPKIVAIIIAAAAALNIIINFILIPLYGIEGAAIATSLTYIFAWLVSNHQIKKLIKTKIQWGNLSKIFFSGILFVLAVFFIKNILIINPYLEFIITLAIAGIIYISLIFLLKIITIKEIKNLINIAKS